MWIVESVLENKRYLRDFGYKLIIYPGQTTKSSFYEEEGKKSEFCYASRRQSESENIDK